MKSDGNENWLYTPPPQTIPIADTSFVRRKWIDIAYADQAPREKLDIYLPDNGDGPFPVIVFLHGGAFAFGDKGDVQVYHPLHALKRGYAVVSVNYSYSWQRLFPVQIMEVKAAVRWMRANAGKYGFDMDRIALWGASAGAYLAAFAAVTANVSELENPSLGNMDQSSRVQAVVDWFAPIDFSTLSRQHRQNGYKSRDLASEDSSLSRLLGCSILDSAELVRTANPETYITEDIPPFFIQHGTDDELVPYQQSIVFAEKLAKAAGCDRVVLELLGRAGHASLPFETPENIRRVLDFLDRWVRLG